MASQSQPVTTTATTAQVTQPPPNPATELVDSSTTGASSATQETLLVNHSFTTKSVSHLLENLHVAKETQ